MKPKVTTEFEHGQATIFKNPFLESLTKTNPVSNIIIYGIAIALMIYVAIDIILLSVLKVAYIFYIIGWNTSSSDLILSLNSWV